jgi:diguanylate cyclase (GGDEF)-like protein
MVANIASATATSTHRWFATALALLLLLSAAASVMVETLPLPVIPAFQPMIAAAVVLSGGVTAFLLFGQFVLSGVPSLALLSAAYLFVALMSAVYALIQEGVPSASHEFLASPNSAVWIWYFWHFGQLSFLVAFAVVHARFPRSMLAERKGSLWPLGMVLATSSLAAALTLLATLGEASLPSLIGPAGIGLSYAAIVADCLGLAVFLAITASRTLLQLWLALALLAATLEAALLPHSPVFSLPWYWAGLNGLFAGASVLLVVCHEMTVLYGRLDELNRRLGQLASVDRLSGLPNRRQFDQRLTLEWRRALRDRAAISVAMIDIDWFKLFNDTYGHLQGDQCIRRVAAAIAACARRPADLAARYGGEEFAVIMAGSDETGAEQLAQRIAAAVRAEQIPHEKNAVTGIVTVSVGIATHRPRLGDHKSWLVEAADHALYEAKGTGRNRVVAGQCVPGIVPGVLASRLDDEEDGDDADAAGAG